MLEDLDFAAGENSDIDPLEGGEPTDEDAELAELMKAKKELMAKMMIATERGKGMPVGDDDDDEEEGWYDEQEDMENLWQQAGLEDGELDGLLADANDSDEEAPKKKKKSKSEKSGKKDNEAKKEKKDKKKKKSKTAEVSEIDLASLEEDQPTTNGHAFAPLEEPAFASAKKSKKSERTSNSDDILGDPTALNDADATDKERRKRSLQFHTSKIASTSARRTAARNQRLGGDEDIPYKDRQAARDAALRKNSQAAVGEDLDGSEWTEKDKKRAREVRDEEAGSDGSDGDDYYDLVKRRKTEKKEAKEAAHEEYQASKLSVIAILDKSVTTDEQRRV